MSRLDNGGSAFPIQESAAIHAVALAAVAEIADPIERDRAYIEARAQAIGGLSVRDYFAAHAPITLEDAMTTLKYEMKYEGGSSDGLLTGALARLAKLRVEYADAMLKARAA